jgi:hypothetical protein
MPLLSVGIVRSRTKGHGVCLVCLCGVVVRVPSYRPEVPGSIPGATIVSEK